MEINEFEDYLTDKDIRHTRPTTGGRILWVDTENILYSSTLNELMTKVGVKILSFVKLTDDDSVDSEWKNKVLIQILF